MLAAVAAAALLLAAALCGVNADSRQTDGGGCLFRPSLLYRPPLYLPFFDLLYSRAAGEQLLCNITATIHTIHPSFARLSAFSQSYLSCHFQLNCTRPDKTEGRLAGLDSSGQRGTPCPSSFSSLPGWHPFMHPSMLPRAPSQLRRPLRALPFQSKSHSAASSANHSKSQQICSTHSCHSATLLSLLLDSRTAATDSIRSPLLPPLIFRQPSAQLQLSQIPRLPNSPQFPPIPILPLLFSPNPASSPHIPTHPPRTQRTQQHTQRTDPSRFNNNIAAAAAQTPLRLIFGRFPILSNTCPHAKIRYPGSNVHHIPGTSMLETADISYSGSSPVCHSATRSDSPLALYFDLLTS